MLNKIILGTAQFGLDYGKINNNKSLKLLEIEKILNLAYKNKINKIDTASVYGDAEKKLGKFDLREWKIYSKIPKIPDDNKNISKWINNQINKSSENLKSNKLDGMLFHSISNLSFVLRNISCTAIKKNFDLKYLGLSVYNPKDFLSINDNSFDFNLVQLPYNIFDRSIEDSYKKIKTKNVRIQVRSIFLQGLLLQKKNNLKNFFQQWNINFQNWFSWLEKMKISNLEGCISLIKNSNYFDNVIVGVTSHNELNDIIKSFKLDLPKPPFNLSTNDKNLIHPINWKIK